MGFIRCAAYIAALGCISFILGRLMPKRWFNGNAFPYRSFRFEKEGAVYDALNIKQWQNLLPDMSRLFPKLMPAKRMTNGTDRAALELMVQETCVAEFTHTLLCLMGLMCLALWRGAGGRAVYAAYVLLGNLPFILIQRYNRPRLMRLMKRAGTRARAETENAAGAGVLILSANNGAGHNSCAQALKEEFEAQGVRCVALDAMAFASKRVSGAVSRLHTFVYRHMPRLFDAGYRFSEKHPGIFGEGSLSRRAMGRGAERLNDYIVKGGFNAVVCTHIFAALMLTDAREKYGLHIASCHVSTDYTCSPGLENSALDMYFIPDRSLAGEFAAAGIPSGKLVPAGLPVRREFACPSGAAAKRTGNILMMCGSMGCGPIEKTAELIRGGLAPAQTLTVVCGTNRKLCNRLKKRYENDPKIKVLGFCNTVSRLMEEADVYLTKPGGISVSEAAAKGVPMVLLDTVSGCEKHNLDFFVARAAAVPAENAADAAAKCLDILRDEFARNRMAHALRQAQPCGAAENICACVLNLAAPRAAGAREDAAADEAALPQHV